MMKKISALALLCLLLFMGAAQADEIRFTDARGKEIVLTQPAERIISLYSAHTENLYALGRENALRTAH